MMIAEDLILGVVLADFVATVAGSAALWRLVGNLDRRLTVLETKYCIQVDGTYDGN